MNKKTVKIKGNTNLSITGSVIWNGDKNGSFFHDFFYKKNYTLLGIRKNFLIYAAYKRTVIVLAYSTAI